MKGHELKRCPHMLLIIHLVRCLDGRKIETFITLARGDRGGRNGNSRFTYPRIVSESPHMHK